MEVWAPVITAAVISFLGALVAARHAANVAREAVKAQREATEAANKAKFEELRREYMLEHRSEDLVRRLMLHPDFKRRSFRKIRNHVGGFDNDEDELRRILIRAGAVRLGFGDQEQWGLIERNEEALGIVGLGD